MKIGERVLQEYSILKAILKDITFSSFHWVLNVVSISRTFMVKLSHYFQVLFQLSKLFNKCFSPDKSHHNKKIKGRASP